MTEKIKVLSLFLLLLTGIAVHGCGNTNKNSNNQAELQLDGSRQGQSAGFADFDGDGLVDKLVGAPYARIASGLTGAVLVYKGSPGGFSSIPAMVLTGDDNFGHTIANLGDINADGEAEFGVSAIHGDGEDVSLCGSVTIYKGGGNGQILKKLSGEWPMDKFGISIAGGDLNNDGKPDIAVGAPFNTNDPALYQAGAVYVFFGPDFSSSVSLYASPSNKGLGWALATGDTDGDGISDLLVSAAGKVLVFRGNASFSPSINAPDVTIASTASGFGKAVAVIGDLDGTAGQKIAIGAPNAQMALTGVPSRDVGSVYVVSAATGTSINVDAAPSGLVARMDGETLFSRFGSSIAALGGTDGDGKSDIAVGAPMKDVNWNTLSGMVYRFKGAQIASGSPWTTAIAFKGAVKNQAYGTSLAAALLSRQTGTMNALLIGAPGSDADIGGTAMIDSETGHAVAGGSSGGISGNSGECH